MIFNRPRRREKKQLTWYFNGKLDSSSHSFSVGFKSAARTQLYDGITKVKLGMKYTYGDKADTAYTFNSWMETGFRTITFDEEPTGDLLAFLEANATPQ